MAKTTRQKILLVPIFPAFTIDFEKYSEYPFQNVYDKNDLKYKEKTITRHDTRTIELPEINDCDIINSGSEEEIAKKKKMVEEYRKILGGSLRHPKLMGFMLDHYDFTKDKKIIKIYPKIGNYELNIFSSHILEYELLRAYESLKSNSNIESIEDFKSFNLWDYLPFRKYIHDSASPKNGDKVRKSKETIEKVLYTGVGRYSLFSVQCFLMFKDIESEEYTTIIGRRSNDKNMIVAKLGYHQFPPAGGFELYEKENRHTANILFANYSLRKPILREYLEEVFNIKDFEAPPNANIETTNRIFSYKETQDILSLIYNKQANFELIGVAVDLVTLRHELSFIIKIDDISYSKKTFSINEEFEQNYIIPGNREKMSDLEKTLKKSVTEGKENQDGEKENFNFNQGSAMLYKMVKKWEENKS